MTNDGIILLVEDDINLSEANRRILELRQYRVYIALTLESAREWLEKISPDIILLDIMLPDGDGIDFCKEIREMTQAHILFLTAKTEHEDMIKGLITGGDDYIAKPFHAKELLARVEAAMRRRRIGVPIGQIKKGPFVLDLLSHRMLLNDEDLMLAKKEFDLLLLLVQNEGRIFSAQEIYAKVWGQPDINDNRALQAAISRCRKKIESTGYHIANIREKGYVFEKI